MASGSRVLKTYNSREVIVTMGNKLATGMADDSFVTIEQKGEGVLSKSGCDGEVARAVDPNEQYVIKLTFLQTSDTNKWMQQRYLYDQATGNGDFPLLIKDLRGGVLFSADAAWITKQTSRTYGKDTNQKEWTLETGPADLTES